MLADLAAKSINAVVFYRPSSMPALDPVRARILRTETRPSGWTVVVVTMKLEIDAVVNVGETIEALPDELHFERSAFDPFDPAGT
jgi:hypothetical protein